MVPREGIAGAMESVMATHAPESMRWLLVVD